MRGQPYTERSPHNIIYSVKKYSPIIRDNEAALSIGGLFNPYGFMVRYICPQPELDLQFLILIAISDALENIDIFIAYRFDFLYLNPV